MNRLFTSATVKLTGWYLLILMVVSLIFSSLLYAVASGELRHGFRPLSAPSIQLGIFTEGEQGRQLREARFQEATDNLLGNLVLFNLGTLVLGGGASYLLARRTLSPIQQAMDAQSRFVSDASHELRTPLAAMRSEIEVALRGKRAKNDLEETLESNLEEVDRLRRLTDRLLLLSAQTRLDLIMLPIDEVVADALENVIKHAQVKNITVENEVGAHKIALNADSFADAITILLENAIKYSPERTNVRVTSDQQGKQLCIRVIDEGPGISHHDIPYIFDRFYRADQARSKQTVEGHGLGLSIAKHIISLHHGSLSVERSSEKGTTFIIRLPIESS
jgi:signal transduction histidine kinase